MTHFQVTNCTATPEKTKQAVVLTYVYANLCLEFVNLIIFAYGAYHIRLMNVSKVFFIELQISKH